MIKILWHADEKVYSTRTIYELKPYNPRAMQQGWKQLYKYQSSFQQTYGGQWNIVLDTY